MLPVLDGVVLFVEAEQTGIIGFKFKTILFELTNNRNVQRVTRIDGTLDCLTACVDDGRQNDRRLSQRVRNVLQFRRCRRRCFPT